MENNINEKVLGNSKFKKFLAEGWDLIKFAIIALAIVIPIRMWVAQPFVVSGESMYPTFDNGQYLIIDEISYIVGNAHRGDVVIFRYPNDTKRFFIKRIIGLPNEKIIINDGSVTIINKENPNGFKMVEPYINEKFFTGKEYETRDNEYFVLGDNRNKSSDSRFWGVLPENLMVGRAYLRLLPLKEMSFLPGNYKQ
ncbi:TPA: signal peptidase I [Candidatus Nomurabacteria bacterium]|uniref:Signal peptidase I n=1 Tax=Candidatus Nomurabacteria bacterium GW2011_GWE1_35_16 TaxID=1618761 RepID=A0A0G0EI10_9BACT|nr:MAG: Signal peptidase I [Candidatus Nomurabacteria bacterium GW2011_GWF1_34_20]KKP63755.1 MAG: Signal peptidase I [Candidatus Nomurabacteria bacterium GW2011_GWE2_34_25]KKP66967.1 MAG: Signal peptidase I [Candidatus Nomurabacteria bacterium GW2011_GWE1_35_16]HAE36789.1 signal peptidase I [Candidatus Nomurabacteria bacterium]HAX65508.1 signal peptidase I [Candidatus Nomurabacteria bacterium]